jgi:hypothetical protein
MRIRGGRNGLLAAIDHGVVDPENADLPEDLPRGRRLTRAELRKVLSAEKERERLRSKRQKKRERSPF